MYKYNSIYNPQTKFKNTLATGLTPIWYIDIYYIIKKINDLEEIHDFSNKIKTCPFLSLWYNVNNAWFKQLSIISFI